MEKIRSSAWYGSLLVALGAAAWSFSGVLSQGLMWNGFTKTGVRGIVASLIFAAFRKTFKVKITFGLVLGALGVALTSLLYMSATLYTSASNAIVLQYSMPAYVILLNFFVFRQKPLRRDIITVLFVMLGVTLCCMEGLTGGKGSMFGNVIALLSGLTFALVFFASRLPGCDPISYSYLGNVFSILLAVSLFFDPNVHFIPTETYTASMIAADFTKGILLGVSLGAGYLFFSLGIRRTSAVSAAIITNLEPVLNPVWVFVFMGVFPGVFGIAGALVVLVTVTMHSIYPRRTK
ncbi:MAG: DMT family transporter [Clostridia bacterium]|nr:DMT family transporter [Clostridia bacterium]